MRAFRRLIVLLVLSSLCLMNVNLVIAADVVQIAPLAPVGSSTNPARIGTTLATDISQVTIESITPAEGDELRILDVTYKVKNLAEIVPIIIRPDDIRQGLAYQGFLGAEDEGLYAELESDVTIQPGEEVEIEATLMWDESYQSPPSRTSPQLVYYMFGNGVQGYWYYPGTDQ